MRRSRSVTRDERGRREKPSISRENSSKRFSRDELGSHKELNIERKEDIGFLNRSKEYAFPRRECSRGKDGLIMRNKSRQGNNDLLQTAVNHNLQLNTKSNSMINLRDKKRDITYKYDSPSNLKSWSEVPKSYNCSPLSVLEEEFNTRIPSENRSLIYHPDNSFNDLNHKFHGDNIEISSTSMVNQTSRLFDKLTKAVNIAHNSMFSLVPALSNFKEPSFSLDSAATNFQSEEEEDNKEEEQDQETWDISPMGSIPRTSGISNPEAIKNEITEFQSSFINKLDQDRHNESLPHSIKIGRVQKKILDYKDLRFNESSELSSSQNYNIKIQNETLINQYHSIRLRFSNKASSSNNRLVSTTGVLGFIGRSSSKNPNSVKHYVNENYSWNSDKLEEGNGMVSFQNKDEYLKQLWDSEYGMIFKKDNSTDANESHKSFTTQLNLIHQKERDENSNILDNGDIIHNDRDENISDLARKIHIN